MSVTVVGSIALDTVETPWGTNTEGLGGAATYFAFAGANYTPVHLVGVIGEDFPEKHIELLGSKDIDLEGMEKARGKTFRWVGRYHEDVNYRDTLDTQLNVFEEFHPKLPDNARNAEYLFLGNIHPSLQLEVLEQSQAKFIALDTMNLWIDISLDELKSVLKRVDAIIINDSEVKDLTGEKNLIKGAISIHELGPKIVLVKKGEHGCMLFQDGEIFAVPAFPLSEISDPTGAGDAFAGGFMGIISQTDSTDFATLKKAAVHGNVVASYTCEKFGPDKLAEIGMAEIESRYEEFRKLVSF